MVPFKTALLTYYTKIMPFATFINFFIDVNILIFSKSDLEFTVFQTMMQYITPCEDQLSFYIRLLLTSIL